MAKIRSRVGLLAMGLFLFWAVPHCLLAAEPLVLPVADDFLKGSILHKGGGPTGSLLYEGLVTKNSRGGYDGWLAESWKSDAAAQVWTFALVKNARWHDGEPFTAQDVKFTYEYMKEKRIWLSTVLWMVERVECPDDYTAVFHLQKSFPTFLDHLSHCPGIAIVPRHIWKDVAEPMRHEDRHPVGTGPFAFVRRVPGQLFEMKRFEGYHGRKPAFEQMILRVINNADIRNLALKSGEIHAVDGVLPWIAPLLERKNHISLLCHPNKRLYGLCFNCRIGPTASSGFRRALAHMVNRQRIAETVFHGYGSPAFSWLMTDRIDKAPDALAFDLDHARKLFAEAGYVMEKDLLCDPTGQPVRLVFVLGGKGAACVVKKMAEVLREDFSRLGITLELKQVDFSMWSKEVHKNHLFMSGMPDLMHDEADDLTHFQTRSFFGRPNWYGYSSEEFDRLAGRLQQTVAGDERQRLALSMQAILLHDVPAVPVCHADSLMAYRTDKISFQDTGETMYGNLVDLNTLLAITPVEAQ
ncbi:peptide ABC transporter substrate-binding protein [Desulfosarcina ovata subsp. sediminis]|uniref:Peptide ABC transporter substrate-binding protein n=1 Tax=Desulfosarcina ovata subsp. sediminis TaxID=885957 RepID=A0A5K7ZNJ6_9BACT|nr:ABC transporter substrate-binding protein [Desulfosarcina ovata]BBO82115.1 peptide ABC transporter substrate-binding protein [Desulfosarcina ovata subsp. sediminis]